MNQRRPDNKDSTGKKAATKTSLRWRSMLTAAFVFSVVFCAAWAVFTHDSSSVSTFDSAIAERRNVEVARLDAKDNDDAANDAIADAELRMDKQRDIWEIENYTFALETYLGKALIEALEQRDREAVARHFRNQFQGRLVSLENDVVRQQGPIEERIRKRPTNSPAVDQDAFLAYLVEMVNVLGSIQQGRLRVLHLDRDPEEPDHWHALVLITFAGSQPDWPLVFHESEHELTLRIPDKKVVGRRPIIEQWWIERESLRRSSQRLMDEVTEAYGLNALPLIDNWQVDPAMAQQYWSQMAVEDYDRDGWPDIAVATFLGRPYLLHNEQGRSFVEVAESMGLAAWPVDDRRLLNLAVWIDYDNDDFPDLLLGDRLYHNNQGQSFTDVTEQSGLRIDHHAMGAAVADYDCDGLLDLYLLYQEPIVPPPSGPQPWVGDTESGAENHLWRNEGQGRFRNVTSSSGAGGGLRKSFAATWHFHDGNRFPDLYIANDFGNNVHLQNTGKGAFEDVSRETAMQDFATSMGVTSGDIDNDGAVEIYVANMYSKMGRRIIDHVSEIDYPDGIYQQILGSCAGNRLYRRSGATYRYQDVSQSYGVNSVGWAYAPAMQDWDGDGWLDIYAATGFMSFDRGKPDG